MTVARLGCVAWMIHRDPGGPPADLVFIQAGQALAGLDEGGPDVRDQGGQRDRVRCGAMRCGAVPGTLVARAVCVQHLPSQLPRHPLPRSKRSFRPTVQLCYSLQK